MKIFLQNNYKWL